MAGGDRDYSVLLVDDENDIRLLWRVLLEQEGCFFPIVEVGDCDGALTHIRNGCFDLVLTNFSMPHASGFEVIEECRRRCRDSLIVMSSAVRVTQAEVEAAGGDLFVPKARAGDGMLPMIVGRLAGSDSDPGR